MKRTILFLLALMTLSLPAYAADFTAQEISDATGKLRIESPQSQKWMREWMPSLFTKMNAITSTTTGAVTYPVLATTTTNSGAKLVGVLDTANYFTGTVVETILAELGLSRSKLALTTSGNGASLIGVYDTPSYFTGTTVEAVLAELGLWKTNLALTTTPGGASYIGVFDTAGYFAGENVEAVLANIGLAMTTYATSASVNTKITTIVDTFSATAPPDPNVEGYRVLMTATNGGLNVGYIYVWDDTGNAWDAGTLLANGQMVASKGAVPDVAIGGAAAANLVKLSGKMSLTIPASVGNIAILGADGQPTDSGDGLAEYSKLIATPTNGNLVSMDALGQSVDSTIAAADISGAVAIGAVANDKMRNSTNTAQELADATAEIIDLEDVETTGDVTYSAGTTSLATIPATGLYAIHYQLTFAASAATYNEAHIYINGADAFDSSETPDNANPIIVDDFAIRYLVATDTVALWGKQDSGGALNVTAGRLGIQRIQ